MIAYLVNPGKQLNKAKDTQRRADFKQIRNALDTYYNDYNCYPATIPFGQEWKIGNTVYMKTIPQDPNCTGNEGCYAYIVDSASLCPQWNVLFGKLAIVPSSATPACLLQTTCLPSNYIRSGYNLCDFGGNIDCAVMQAVELIPDANPQTTTTPTPTGSSGITPTVAPTITPTPTLIPTPTSFVPTNTPIPTFPPGGVYYCGCGNNHTTVCNITFTIPLGIQYYLDSSCSNQCETPC